VEAEFSRKSEESLQGTITAINRVFAEASTNSEQELRAERSRNATLETENKELRARLHAMNALLKQLM
jgi:hypothetical protein